MTSRARVLSLAITTAILLPACDLEDIDHVPAGSATDTSESMMMEGEESFASDVATAYCAALFACGGASACDAHHGLAYDNEQDCVIDEQSRLQELQTNAVAGGLTYDHDCAQRAIANYAAVECRSMNQTIMQVPSAFTAEGFGCQPYVGTVPENDGTCIEVAGTNLSDCAADLQCLDDTCRAETGWIHPCLSPCPEGTACTDSPFGGSDQCLPILTGGEACVVGGSVQGYCDPQHYCDSIPAGDGSAAEGTCAPLALLGEACNNDVQCETFACDGSVCVTEAPVLCQYPPRQWRSN